ncbi:MAG TPA: TonB-dependent receptor, partial [Candidatus Melainabacteria bacterium]|nr:TonB-dependent receptor [Candidatus Melainabacteria bacterium]HIN63767.1 TonB-dependent receptor [Candidatus Obscuribacterales bacterium]
MSAFLVFARFNFVLAAALITINSQALAQNSAQSSPEVSLPQSEKPAATSPLAPPLPPASASPTSMPTVSAPAKSSPGAISADVNVEPPAKGKSTIYGVVKDDATRKPLSKARIVLSGRDEEHKRHHVETGPDGSYSFKDIDPGNWTLTFSHNEMLSHTEEVTIAADQSKGVNVVLEDLEPVDVMRVTGKRTLIHPEKIGSTTNIPRRILEEYRSGNDLRQLVESTPGVITDTYGNIITRGEHNSINYELDGVVLPEAAGVLQQSQPATPRSLQSMQVDIGGYEAHDGGGPLGAIVRMKSRNIEAKPKLTVGGQIGGPMAGNIYYDTTGAFSANPQSKLHRLRWESSGQFIGTSYRLVPYTKQYSFNQGMDINTLSKLEYKPNERDTFRLTAGINQSFMRVPLPQTSAALGVKQKQTDMQNFIIAAWRRTGRRFYDEANIAFTNAFYRETFASRGLVFDPLPVVNGEEPAINSVQPTAKRFNYVFSAQGNLKKLVKTHNLETGFYSEIRPVQTSYGAIYRNANLLATAESGGSLPYGAIINPFTFEVGGPNITGGITKFNGFRYLQSGWAQDTWKPKEGFLKRLTVNAGVRADVYH